MPAEIRAAATAAFDFFVDAYGVKWDEAVAKLIEDRNTSLSFYDFPAEHWKHICRRTRSGAPSPPFGTEPGAPGCA